MRKLLLFLGMVIILSSCQQQLLNEPKSTDATEVTKVKHPGMSRMKFSSREQIQECATLVEQISSKSLLTRALATNTEFTDGDEEFRSLYEENKDKVLRNLSSEELAILNNDPDELEYELTDSIIADYRFAQLLNAN